jgi:hypothetical protein
MAVRHQPKPLYGFNRFGCTGSAVLRVRLPPKPLFVFARFTQLTTRGRRLVDALHAREAELVQDGKLPDGQGLFVAQEGFFAMQVESYYGRPPRIFGFRQASA